MKTREEVQWLKAQWLEDPCWDIEETEGYADYYDELSAFRQRQESKWKRLEEIRIRDKAVRLGIPGKLRLAQYVEDLEDRIEKLTWQVEILKKNSITNQNSI